MSGTESAARVPYFFIAGHAKCGTTALYEALRAHPQVWMPDVKEPRYFATDMRRRFTPARSGRLPETMEEYLALFAAAPPDAIVGEASPSYVVSHSAPRLIAKARPDARIVVIFREPADFLRSLHLQLIQSHVETQRDLATALSLEVERAHGHKIPRRSHRPQSLQYSEHVRYSDQLARLRAAFAEEQLLVLIYDDLRADNPGTLQRVLRFIGADPALSPRGAPQANPSVLIRAQGLETAMNALATGRGPLGAAASRAVKTLLPASARRRAMSIVRSQLIAGDVPPVDDALMRTLRRRYKGEVEAFGEAIDRDLIGLWGYDRD
jgi:hypothetical protein